MQPGIPSLMGEIASALASARSRTGMNHVQFTRELKRLAPDLDLTATDLEQLEAGSWHVFAEHLLAAARVVGQPVSALLGEEQMYAVTIPDLERRVMVLEALMEGRGMRSA
jgi:hypothetical protein